MIVSATHGQVDILILDGVLRTCPCHLADMGALDPATASARRIF